MSFVSLYGGSGWEGLYLKFFLTFLKTDPRSFKRTFRTIVNSLTKPVSWKEPLGYGFLSTQCQNSVWVLFKQVVLLLQGQGTVWQRPCCTWRWKAYHDLDPCGFWMVQRWPLSPEEEVITWSPPTPCLCPQSSPSRISWPILAFLCKSSQKKGCCDLVRKS